MSAEVEAFGNKIATAIVELQKWQAEDPEGFLAIAEMDRKDVDFMRRNPEGYAAQQADVAAMMAEPVTEEDIKQYHEEVARHLAAEKAEHQ